MYRLYVGKIHNMHVFYAKEKCLPQKNRYSFLAYFQDSYGQGEILTSPLYWGYGVVTGQQQQCWTGMLINYLLYGIKV